MFIRKSLELGRGSFQSMSQTTGCCWYYNSSFPQKWVHSCTLHVWYWTWAIESSLHCHHMFPVPHFPPQIIITWWDFAIYYSPPKHQIASLFSQLKSNILLVWHNKLTNSNYHIDCMNCNESFGFKSLLNLLFNTKVVLIQ